MTFQEVLKGFGFEHNRSEWAHEYRVLIGGSYYYAFLHPQNENVKWQGQHINDPEELVNVFNTWLVSKILEM